MPVARRAAVSPGPQATGPLGRRACPLSCGGGAAFTETGYGGTIVCWSCLSVVVESVARSSGALAAQLLMVTRESAGDGWGSDGTEASTRAKLNTRVMSPVTERRHAVRFGTSAPKRTS